MSGTPTTSDNSGRDAGLEARVEAVVGGLSHEEKVAIALGDFASLTGRGLPVPNYVDSGTGLRDTEGATAFPAGIALAATFDPALAEEYGRAVGEEARASGFTVVLGPTLDLARDPRAGRIPEALGEDPHLSGLLAAAHVRGMQGTHVIAQLKHFVAYNGEDRRTGYGHGPARGDAVDVRISEAGLHDAYARPFEAAIKAGAWSMMGSYNRLNGTYACESAEVLSMPRELWGWRGFYCPDFLFAVRDDARALAAGLDLPALGGAAGRTAEMVEAAPPEVLAALVGNLVRALIGSGLADDPLPAETTPASTPHHRDIAERTAIASTVLLKNADAVLPFGEDIRSVALIGPSGADALFVTGGSAAVSLDPGRLVTPADGVRAAAGGRTIELAQGSFGDVPLPVVPVDVLTLLDGSGPGVQVEFVDESGRTWTGALPAIDHAADPAAPLARWPRRWSALLTPRVTGSHRLSLEVGGRATVRVDGRTVMVGSRESEQFIHGPHSPLQAVVDLVAGTPVALEIEWELGPALVIPPMGIGPTLRLGWQEPDGLIAEAEALAARCDAAVVIVNQVASEGMDRDGLALPGDQDELVQQVAAANPRTVVVLNTPGAVELPWLAEAAAVLQVWYPGERFGSALGRILFGDAEPGGRLPLTFPHAREHLPGGDHGPETVPTELDYDADGGIGYRAPGVREHGSVFAFGHGLGYADTTCRVSDAVAAGGAATFGLRVTNHGGRDTVHVAQLYAQVADEAPELVGIVRVPVAAGAVATARAEITADAFACWDGAARRRVPVAGVHRVFVGTASDAVGSAISVTVETEKIVAVAG
jgi:beta-glucosidase